MGASDGVGASDTTPAIGVGLLGPVELVVDGRAVPLGGLRRRAVLAVLAAARTAVPADRLADAVWSDTGRPPARNTVQVHVHQLRQALAPHSTALRHTPAGYRLDGAVVDVALVEDGLRRARAAVRAGDVGGGAEAYRATLRIWRGELCEDLPELGYFQAARAFYAALRLDAHEAALAAELRLGTAGLAAELEALVAAHPLREGLWGQLMVALYREGRQAEASGAYRRARAALAEEAGVDPGAALRRLQQAVLAQAGTSTLVDVVAPRARSVARLALTWLDETGAPVVRELADGRVEIGRDPGADVALRGDAAVSRRHARVDVAGGTATLVDLGSRNGTIHNGVRLDPGGPARALRSGDTIRCGGTVVLVAGPGAAPAPPPHPDDATRTADVTPP